MLNRLLKSAQQRTGCYNSADVLNKLAHHVTAALTTPTTWQAQIARRMDAEEAALQSGLSKEKTKEVLRTDTRWMTMDYYAYTKWKNTNLPRKNADEKSQQQDENRVKLGK